jgi:hypothetical protein
MVDPAGGKIGTLVDIHLDDGTGRPEWATVTTGLFGARQSFVPLAEAEDLGDSVRMPYAGSGSRARSGSGLPAGAAGEDVDQHRTHPELLAELDSARGLP